MLFKFYTFQDCKDVSAPKMTCITPDLKASNLSTPFTVNKRMIGFILDGVQRFQSLGNVDSINFEKFTVYQDPIYHKFPEEGRIKEFHYAERKYLEIMVCTS